MAKRNSNKTPKVSSVEKKEEMTLFDIIARKQVIQKILNFSLPASSAFKLSRVARFFNEEFEAIEQMRKQLVEKHGAKFKDKKTNAIVIPPESEEYQAWYEEFEGFLKETTVKLPEFDRISMKDISNVTLSANDIILLEDFIED